MNSKIIRSIEDFYKLKHEWERLEVQSPDVTYYSTFEYISTWWKIYESHRNLELFIVVIYHNNKVNGIAPLLIEKIKRRFFIEKKLKFLGRGDYLDFLIDFTLEKPINIIKDIFRTIENNADWDTINLTHISHKSLLAKFFLKTKEYNAFFTYLVETPYFKISDFDSFKEYSRNYVSKNSKKYLNKLEREFDIRCETVYGDVIDIISEIHRKEKEFLITTKNRKERYSLFEDNKRYIFHKKVYNVSSNVLTYFFYNNKDQIMAYDTGYLYKNIFYSWNMAYNPEFSNYRLGKVINRIMIEDNFKNRIWDIFDFGSGRYPWKFEYANSFNLVYQLNYTRPNKKTVIKYNKLMLIKRAVKSCLKK